jgi:hypothetical protein
MSPIGTQGGQATLRIALAVIAVALVVLANGEPTQQRTRGGGTAYHDWLPPNDGRFQMFPDGEFTAHTDSYESLGVSLDVSLISRLGGDSGWQARMNFLGASSLHQEKPAYLVRATEICVWLWVHSIALQDSASAVRLGIIQLPAAFGAEEVLDAIAIDRAFTCNRSKNQ